jgi:hypothetical protein
MTDRPRRRRRAPRGDYDPREIDRMALDGERSAWQERTAPAAGDPVSDDERRALNLLGQSDPRGDGSINGVSDTNAGDVARDEPIARRRARTAPQPAARRRRRDGDGGLSASGGAAGGA